MLQVRAIPGKTGRLLVELLGAKGLLTGPVQGVVNYGHAGVGNLPTLNKRAGVVNKLEELLKLREANVPVVPVVEHLALTRRHPTVVLGRSLHHTKGKDIVIYPAMTRLAQHDFFTQLIPKAKEFRVWAYRRTPIGVYEKVLDYPAKYGRRGRSKEIWNRRNGFSFKFVHPDTAPAELKQLGARAVDALGLDFGAVDIILGKDGKYYVLEVNTAPGVESPRQAMVSLVAHIEKWARGGFKKRNGDVED